MSEDDDDLYYFDEKAASKIVTFAQTLKHIKAEWAGKPIVLDPWEVAILRDVFGWKKKSDGTRRYRTLYLEVPRKNGKSLLGAVIALYLFFCDEEPGAEIYSAASDRKQARVIFDVAKAMVKRATYLKKRVKIFKDFIYWEEKESYYHVCSADAFNKDGLNAHGIIFDELHAQKTRDLYDVLRTSVGARRQALEVYITTAGFDEETICWEVHDYCLKVRDGILKDDTFYGVIYAADKEDDPFDPATWRKANPGLGISVKYDYIEKAAQEAKNKPSYLPTFKRLHLNIWTNQINPWLEVARWDQCNKVYEGTQREQLLRFLGRTAYIGVDLSSRVDLTALTMVFPSDDFSVLDVITWFFMPEETAKKRQQEDRVPYLDWAQDGWIELIPGETIDIDFILERLDEWRELVDIPEVAIDPWGSTQFENALDKKGYTVVQFRQGFKTMSPAMKDFEALVVDTVLQSNSNPCLRWNISNVNTKEDDAGNIKPVKGSKKNKGVHKNRIDGAVSSIMGVSRAWSARSKKSIYEKKGVEVVNAKGA